MPRQLTNDPDTDAFWSAVDGGRIAVQKCAGCGTLRFPPGPVCASCATDDADWVDVSGRARVLSWTTTHHRFSAAFADRLPYVVVLVELVEQADLAMYGSCASTDGLVEGALVLAALVDGVDGERIIEWELVDPASDRAEGDRP